MDTNRIEQDLTEKARPFLQYLQEWLAELPALPAGELFSQPNRAAILSVDLTRGFCESGALASPRVGALVPPNVALFQKAWDLGVRHLILSQDTHAPEAVEFGAYPAHCVRGTVEAQTVAEIQRLPFYQQAVIFEKNSISSTANTGLNGWLDQHLEVDTFVVVGDCTDLCVYQLAMDLRTEANARQMQRRVIVPVDCVDTYDLPVEAARAAGILPHPGDLMHAVFLYNMALNGVEVVKKIA
jgi:nicotinamidase-related amidase